MKSVCKRCGWRYHWTHCVDKSDCDVIAKGMGLFSDSRLARLFHRFMEGHWPEEDAAGKSEKAT